MFEKRPPSPSVDAFTPGEPSHPRAVTTGEKKSLLNFTVPPEIKAEINLNRILELLAEGVAMPPLMRAKILDRLRRLDITEEDIRRPPLRGYRDIRERPVGPVSELIFHGEILLQALTKGVPFSPNVRKELMDALRKGDE